MENTIKKQDFTQDLLKLEGLAFAIGLISDFDTALSIDEKEKLSHIFALAEIQKDVIINLLEGGSK